MVTLVVIVLMIVGFYFVRNRIMDSVTDSVTRRNTHRLGRLLLMLVGLFLLLIVLAAVCSRGA